MPSVRVTIAHLQFAKWWALVRFARWLGVPWRDVPERERVILEMRLAAMLASREGRDVAAAARAAFAVSRARRRGAAPDP